jgi:hypothetical protein
MGKVRPFIAEHRFVERRRMDEHFQLLSEYKPQGDQPEAIETLANGLLAGDRFRI